MPETADSPVPDTVVNRPKSLADLIQDARQSFRKWLSAGSSPRASVAVTGTVAEVRQAAEAVQNPPPKGPNTGPREKEIKKLLDSIQLRPGEKRIRSIDLNGTVPVQISLARLAGGDTHVLDMAKGLVFTIAPDGSYTMDNHPSQMEGLPQFYLLKISRMMDQALIAFHSPLQD